MPAKKQTKPKAQTLSLSEFQSGFGESTSSTSWADHGDDDFLNSLPSTTSATSVEKVKEENASTTSTSTSGYSLDSLRAQKKTSNYERPYDGPRDFEHDRSSGFSRPSRPQRPKNEPPTEAPWVAYVANMPFTAMREDLEDFFRDVGCAVLRVKFSTDHETKKFKGYGYVVFGDLESLTTAVSMSEKEFFGRPLRVDYTDRETSLKHGTIQERNPFGDRPFQPRERRQRYEDDRPLSEADKDNQWRRATPISPSSEQKPTENRNPFGNMKRNYQQRPQREQNMEEKQEMPLERPKLNLKPRTTDAPVAGSNTSGSDLFGEGKAWEKVKDERIEKKLSDLDIKKTEEPATAEVTEKPAEVQPEKKHHEEENSNPFNFKKKNYNRDQPRERREYREPREGEEKKSRSYDFASFKSRNNQEERKPRFEGERPQRREQPKQDKPAPQTKSAPTNINTFDALGEEND